MPLVTPLLSPVKVRVPSFPNLKEREERDYKQRSLVYLAQQSVVRRVPRDNVVK